MCQRQCCPGTGHRSGPGAAIALVVILIIAAAARPAIHAALDVLHIVITITVITAASAAGLAVLAAATMVIRRARARQHSLPASTSRTVTGQAPPLAAIPVPAPVAVPGRAPLALAAPPPDWAQQAGVAPDQAAFLAAVLEARDD